MKILLEVEIPDGCEEEVHLAVERIAKDLWIKKEWGERILTDEGLAFIEKRRGVPMLRERDYPSDEYWYTNQRQVYGDWGGSKIGDMRPVAMRGAREVLQRKYCLSPGGSAANGWHLRIAERWFRMKKITGLHHHKEVTDALAIIEARFGDIVSRPMYLSVGYAEDRCCYINGEKKYYDRKQASAMRSLITKINTGNILEKRNKRLGTNLA